MISMTGFAYRENSGKEISVSVEIKGYNNRYLEINVNLPQWLTVLESRVREKITKSCGRGKVDVYIRIREYNAAVTVNINKNAARAYYDAINEIANELGINEKPGIDALLKAEGIFDIEKNRDEERYWNEIRVPLDEAIELFCLERKREGDHTENDIMQNIKKLEVSLHLISSFAPVIEQNLKDNIKTRFTEIFGNQVDENRILAETAVLLVKNTISEEICRLAAHLGEFRSEAQKNLRPGKKLDFLCQEINREINTIGSKSAIVEVTAEVVSMKEALENIREQLRNIE